jgi:hypothetical protein
LLSAGGYLFNDSRKKRRVRNGSDRDLLLSSPLFGHKVFCSLFLKMRPGTYNIHGETSNVYTIWNGRPFGISKRSWDLRSWFVEMWTFWGQVLITVINVRVWEEQELSSWAAPRSVNTGYDLLVPDIILCTFHYKENNQQ